MVRCVFAGPFWGSGGLDALRGARKRDDGHRRSLRGLSRLPVHRPCPGRRRRRTFPFVFRRRSIARWPLHARRTVVVAGRDRRRRLHFGSDGFRRHVSLRLERAQQCLGDRRRRGGPGAAGLALQARPAGAKGLRWARYQERYHQPLRSFQPVARHIGGYPGRRQSVVRTAPPPWSPPTPG